MTARHPRLVAETHHLLAETQCRLVGAQHPVADAQCRLVGAQRLLVGTRGVAP